jgi:hypothetical protein
MGLVDLSYGPFGHPLYGPYDYHPNLCRDLGRAQSPRVLLLPAPGQHAQFDSPYRRLSAVGDTKFRDDTANVLLYRAHADEELSGYLLVCVSSRYQPKHLPLTN